jgi:hypothetical protein
MENKTSSSSYNNCTSAEEGWRVAHIQFCLVAKEMKKWILLDNRSLVDLFCNPNLDTKIKTTNNEMLEVSTQWQKIIYQLESNHGEVWYNPNAVTNILVCYLKYRKGTLYHI